MKHSAESILQWNKYVEEAYKAQEKYRKHNGEKVILENIIPIELNESQEIPENYNCPFLGKELWISPTGKISPCCAPDEMRQTLGNFGNIENNTIESILNSDNYINLITHYKQIPLCKTCNMRKP